VNVFAAHIGGQEELTALTLNNIFGENQIANGVNIQSGGGGAGSPGGNSGSQINESIQSWGSANIPGQLGKQALLWEFADEIADATSANGPATAANIVVTIVAGTFDPEAQYSLTALTVNNVFGFNQVANGTNISSGTIDGTGITAGAGVAVTQRNSSEQWRGAPKGYTDVSTFN
jgi:hypothetical protein